VLRRFFFSENPRILADAKELTLSRPG